VTISTPDPHQALDLKIAGAHPPEKTSCRECRKVVEPTDRAFLDLVMGLFLCHQCGVRIRYHRKRAFFRGEKIPITFADVEARVQLATSPPAEVTL